MGLKIKTKLNNSTDGQVYIPLLVTKILSCFSLR